MRDFLKEKGISVCRSPDELEENEFEVITLFHVFEHLTDPIGTLKDLKKKLISGGKVIIEVPHARDFLIDTLGCEAFKRFTFWSEHLILHTRTSLQTFIQEAGLSTVTLIGYQRYPLSNHLYWLAKERPGGHKHWHHLNRDDVTQSYESAAGARSNRYADCYCVVIMEIGDTILFFTKKYSVPDFPSSPKPYK